MTFWKRHVARTLLTLMAALVMGAEQGWAEDDSPSVSNDPFDDEYSESANTEIWDPAEPVNRAIFSVNDKVDVYVLEPVAKGYDAITPDPVQRSIGNFFQNLGYPSYLVSDLVQLKFDQAATHTGRFLVNSTVGLLGFFDVADSWGMHHRQEDFGLALARHGVPAGPYVVLPFYGPSNVRDTFGRVVDFFLDPLAAVAYVGGMSYHTRYAIGFGAGAFRVVDDRAGVIDAVDSAKGASLDYYSFVQSAYYQYRKGLLEGRRGGDYFQEDQESLEEQ